MSEAGFELFSEGGGDHARAVTGFKPLVVVEWVTTRDAGFNELVGVTVKLFCWLCFPASSTAGLCRCCCSLIGCLWFGGRECSQSGFLSRDGSVFVCERHTERSLENLFLVTGCNKQ